MYPGRDLLLRQPLQYAAMFDARTIAPLTVTVRQVAALRARLQPAILRGLAHDFRHAFSIGIDVCKFGARLTLRSGDTHGTSGSFSRHCA